MYDSLYCNNIRSVFPSVSLSLLETPFSHQNKYDLVDSSFTSAFVDTIKFKGDIMNAKSPTGYENLIGDLDDIQREVSEWSLKKCRVNNINYDQNKELKRCDHSDDGNENNDDTFHNATQVESVNDGTDDDNNDDRKPINNGSLQPVDKRKGTTGIMHEHEGILYVQHLMPDLLDHLDNISMPDLYSNKQWNQPNQHDCSKQDLYGPLKHVYNRIKYYGEQRLTLYIINDVVGD